MNLKNIRLVSEAKESLLDDLNLFPTLQGSKIISEVLTEQLKVTESKTIPNSGDRVHDHPEQLKVAMWGGGGYRKNRRCEGIALSQCHGPLNGHLRRIVECRFYHVLQGRCITSTRAGLYTLHVVRLSW